MAKQEITGKAGKKSELSKQGLSAIARKKTGLVEDQKVVEALEAILDVCSR